MRKLVVGIVALGMLGTVTGCASRGAFGRSGPDEFAVARAAPLVVPPDFALVPPAPGAPRAVESDSSRQALEAMFGPQQRSAGELTTLQEAGEARAAEGIRSTVGDPGTNVVDKGAATRDIVAAPVTDSDTARTSTTATTTTPQPQ